MDINQMTLELVDDAGERKFVKTKLSDRASTFLTEKGRYYLAQIVAGNSTFPKIKFLDPEDPEEEVVELIKLNGYCIRTYEED